MLGGRNVPSSTGQLQLQDYDAALVARGFDGFQPLERKQLINFGYRYVARQYPWWWEQSIVMLPMSVGDGVMQTAGATPLGASNISGVYIASDPYRRKLLVMKQEQFEAEYLPQDLTKLQNCGIPSYYYVHEHKLYILPPPNVTMQFNIEFDGYLLDMVNDTDVPQTPQILDEVILDAALVRAHRRAHELDLAADAQQRVDSAIMDMLADDVWQMSEQQERVVPDNQWL